METATIQPTGLDTARLSLIRAQDIAQQARDNALQLEWDVRQLGNQYLPSATAIAHKEALQARLKSAVAYAKDTSDYVKSVQSLVESRERALTQCKQVIESKDSQLQSAERDRIKLLDQIERANQQLIHQQDVYDGARRQLVQSQGRYDALLYEPLTLADPPAQPDTDLS